MLQLFIKKVCLKDFKLRMMARLLTITLLLSLQVWAEPKIYFVQTDHLGTPQALYSDDATPQIVWRADYKPFGEATVNEDPDGDGNLVSLPIRFPGQYYDNETGLHYNYFRDYDPSLGRYVQSDPIGLQGGLNTYAYVGGNPLVYSDPLGLAKKITPGSPYGGLGNSIAGGGAGSRACPGGSARNPSGTVEAAARSARTQPHNTETLTHHARNRMETRNVSSGRVREAIDRGKTSSNPGSPVVKKEISAADSTYGRGTSVLQDVRTNNVVTVVDKGS